MLAARDEQRTIGRRGEVEIFALDASSSVMLPFFVSSVKAGLPSFADSYAEKDIDLNEYLIKNPAATFIVKVSNDSMIGAGIFAGDLLVVDRSLEAKNNSVVIAVVKDEFLVRRLKKSGKEMLLVPENPLYQPQNVSVIDEFEIWGVVTNVIHSLL